MTIKCECKHCQTHLEFESQDAGRTITCPSCGVETLLCAPEPSPIPKVDQQEAERLKKAAEEAERLKKGAEEVERKKQAEEREKQSTERNKEATEALKRIRSASCYKTLRSVIEMLKTLMLAVACVLFIITVIVAIEGVKTGVQGVFVFFAGLIPTCLICIFAIAWEQAMLLLVDIADSQIHQTIARSGTPSAQRSDSDLNTPK